MELVNMDNKNTMIALAYIQSTNNPYDIFCKYICYTLDTKEYRNYEETNKIILDSFGIKLPFYVYTACLPLLVAEGKIEVNKERYNITGCKLLDNQFDKTFFETDKRVYMLQERDLLADIIKFVKEDFNKDWDEENARRILGNFLRLNSSSLFLEENDYVTSNETQVIKEYILKLDEHSPYKDYIMNIVKGQMLLLGATYSDTLNNKHKIEGTTFYLDTKLILRYLGYSTPTYVTAVRDLVDLIRKRYHGSVHVFMRNVKEVSSALFNFSQALNQTGTPSDYELTLYYQLNKEHITKELFSVRADMVNLTQQLNEANITIVPDINWENKEDWIFNINQEELLSIIREKKPKWNINSIVRDIESFVQINMLRHGDYTSLYGGDKNKLPIFVTSNYPLVRFIKNYIKDSQDFAVGVSKNPFIGDNVLMCQLWLPISQEANDIPITLYNLMAKAISSYENTFFNKFKDSAIKLNKEFNLAIINIDEYRYRQVINNCLKSGCDVDTMDGADLLLASREVEIENKIATEKEIELMAEEARLSLEKVTNLEAELIGEKTQKYLTPRFTAWRFLHLLSKHVLPLTCTFLVIISSLLSIIVTTVKTGYIVGAVGVIISFVVNLANKYTDKVIDKHISKIKDWLNLKSFTILKKKIEYSDSKYSQEIIEYIQKNTTFFSKS